MCTCKAKPDSRCAQCKTDPKNPPQSNEEYLLYLINLMKSVKTVDDAVKFVHEVGEYKYKLLEGEIKFKPDTDIVSLEKAKIVIPKFSVNSAVFITYTSFSGDKSKTNIRAISFPNSEVLFKDLALLNDDIIRLYFKEFHICMLPTHLPLFAFKTDNSDTAFANFVSREGVDKASTCGVISICVIPNAQNLNELCTQQGNLAIMPLREYDEELFNKVRDFILSDFNIKSNRAMAKMMPLPKPKKDKDSPLSDKDAERAWLTLLRYYDKVPAITEALAQVMVTVRKEIYKKE